MQSAIRGLCVELERVGAIKYTSFRVLRMERREFEFELSLVFFWAFEEAEKSRWLLGFKRDITLKKQKHKKTKAKKWHLYFIYFFLFTRLVNLVHFYFITFGFIIIYYYTKKYSI